MAKLEQEKSLEEQIIEALEKSEVRKPRPYLGYSSIAHKCDRFLWYSFRWVHFEEISGRIIRLFSRGEQEEEVLKKEFKKIGVEIKDSQKEVSGVHGHALGHIDGILYDTPWFDVPVLFEAKTYNDKNFKKLIKEKVKYANYVYYVQMQMYMGKLGLEKALFIATNKNDDNRYVEIIAFDELAFDMFERRAENIILTDDVPNKMIDAAPTWFECKFCQFYMICFYGDKPNKNCRTCASGVISNNKSWKCGKTENKLSYDEQLAGCDKYDMLKTLK